MFQFPRSSPIQLFIHRMVIGHYTNWVSPFGHLWVIAHLQLTKAFRRLSRPSSPSSAKASTVRPFHLTYIYVFHKLFRSYLI